jgi:hypothetical protein
MKPSPVQDLINKKFFLVVSCKFSVHEQLYCSLFWFLASVLCISHHILSGTPLVHRHALGPGLAPVPSTWAWPAYLQAMTGELYIPEARQQGRHPEGSRRLNDYSSQSSSSTSHPQFCSCNLNSEVIVSVSRVESIEY